MGCGDPDTPRRLRLPPQVGPPSLCLNGRELNSNALPNHFAVHYGSRMPERRVPAPTVTEGKKLQGPASYFPGIEKKYGRPIQEWLDLAAGRLGDHAHMEVVAWLKEEHGLGHGHANAVVAYTKSTLAADG